MLVWTLGIKGRKRFGLVKKLKLNKNSLNHDLTCSDVRMKLEQLKIATLFRSAFKVREQLTSGISPEDRSLDQIPDWLCSFNFKSAKKITSIEIELNYKGKKRMEKIINTYAYKKEIERIIYFVPTLSMGKKMIQIANEYEFKRGKTWFMFLTLADFFKFNLDAWVYYQGGRLRLNQICNAHPSDQGVSKLNLKGVA